MGCEETKSFKIGLKEEYYSDLKNVFSAFSVSKKDLSNYTELLSYKRNTIPFSVLPNFPKFYASVIFELEEHLNYKKEQLVTEEEYREKRISIKNELINKNDESFVKEGEGKKKKHNVEKFKNHDITRIKSTTGTLRLSVFNPSKHLENLS